MKRPLTQASALAKAKRILADRSKRLNVEIVNVCVSFEDVMPDESHRIDWQEIVDGAYHCKTRFVNWKTL